MTAAAPNARSSRPTIATWVAGVTLLSLLPLLVFSVTALQRQHADEQERNRAALQRRAVVAARAIGHELASVQGQLRTMGLTAAARSGDLAALHEMAVALVASDPRLATVSLSHPDGRQTFHSGRPFGTPLPDSSAIPKAFFDGDAAYVSPLVTAAVLKRPVVGVATPITLGTQGRVALRAVVQLDALNQRLNEQQWPPEWIAAVLDQNRVIVARSREPERFVGQTVTASLREGLSDGGAVYEADAKDGPRMIVAAARVPGVDWYVAVGRPVASLNAQVRDSMLFVLIGAAVCIALAIAGALLFSRHLGRQLQRVVAAHTATGAAPAPASGVREVAELDAALWQAREAAQAARAEIVGRLEERSEMLDVLAHEVRQPLNNASAALQAATGAMRSGGGPAVADAVARAEVVLSEVHASIDNTLAVASLLVAGDRVWQRESDIDSLVAVAIADLPSADAGRVQVERATPTRTASMDFGLMRLALRNLLSNALKFSPADRPVTLRIADSDEPLALLIDVIDHGPGIDAEMLPRLFERADKPVRNPTGRRQGLGLYIVGRVMELHHGSVRVEHTGADGTTMRLVIEQNLDD